MKKFICIHAHFYQPPRENPWVETVPNQESAHPCSNWNERVTGECYRPNTKARIRDPQGRIDKLINNYSRISFDFGPTLLSWLEHQAPEVYQAILQADQESQVLFSGHGSALAQCYSHMIMPLANRRDKYTQVYWGIRDFEYRFKRMPEGMWLPETAVDLETLEIMADLGIRFTLLAPYQAKRVRLLQGGVWQETPAGAVDTTQPYSLHLPTGKSIHLFFYQGNLSRQVAFENLLQRGEHFVKGLMAAFSEGNDLPQLVHMATDGETYGHHHKFGEMALAYALETIRNDPEVDLTNYGEFLEKCSTGYEVEIGENTSWSCTHGVERWRSDCGCQTGGDQKWNQKWRSPLRDALNWLRYTLAQMYEETAQRFLPSPWEARDHYIELVLDRSAEKTGQFLNQNGIGKLKDTEIITVIKLLELQRNAMLMYTSCGWFFHDLSGIETKQILQYAGRAIQLAEELFEKEIKEDFLKLLEQAVSNDPQEGNGRTIYEKTMADSMISPKQVCAQFALQGFFDDSDFPSQSHFYCYRVDREKLENSVLKGNRLVLGRVKLTSEIIPEPFLFHFSVFHGKNFDLGILVNPIKKTEKFKSFVKEVNGAFADSEFSETVRQLEDRYGVPIFSLNSLSPDQRKTVFHSIENSVWNEIEPLYQKSYEAWLPLIRLFKEQGIEPPETLTASMEALLKGLLRYELEKKDFNMDRIPELLEETNLNPASLDLNGYSMKFQENYERLAQQVLSTSAELSSLNNLISALELIPRLPVQINLWQIENVCFGLQERIYPEYKKKAERGDAFAKEWLDQYTKLANILSIRTH